MKRISILIVEDNRLLREGIAEMIGKQGDMKVVGAYGDTVKALHWIRESVPDIVLLDLGLINQNSLQFVRQIKNNFKELKVVVMDLVPVQEDVLNFVQAGVEGFLLKDATIEEFLHTIRSVSNGEKILPYNLTGSLFSQIINKAVTDSDPSKLIDAVRMTKRERQVIELISEGLTNKEIAQSLHLSPFTIKSHVHNILEKLTLHTRVQIARYANTNSRSSGLDSE